MPRLSPFALGLFALCAFSQVSSAQVKLEGTFVANNACDAVVSIKKGTNPDQAKLKPGQSYHLVGQNSENPSHFYVDVPGADPVQRWVEISCGKANTNQGITTAPDKGAVAAGSILPPAGGAAVNTPDGTVKPKPKSRGFGGQEPYYVLALSWEPTFCEAMQDKAECRAIRATSWEASHFTLHGLWPQPFRNQFCNVPAQVAALDDQHKWEQLPEPQLSSETKKLLDRDMPGTKSVLERHEWIKHGTCYPGDKGPDGYFRDEMKMADEVNASPIRDLIANNIGKPVTAAQIRAAFDKVYGAGAGAHVEVDCDRHGRFEGVVLNLRGDIPGGDSLKDLLMNGDTARGKCDGGLVDAVR